MAYGTIRTKPTTEFGKWLDTRMQSCNMSALEIASKLHCGHSVIYHHRSGRGRPTFSDVIAYCWVFKCPDDPEVVWKMTDMLIVEGE